MRGVRVNWKHDGKWVRQVRCIVNHRGALVQRLLDHFVLLDVKLHYGLLQVPHATVDELRAPGGGTRGEVVALDQRGFQSCELRNAI